MSQSQQEQYTAAAAFIFFTVVPALAFLVVSFTLGQGFWLNVMGERVEGTVYATHNRTKTDRQSSYVWVELPDGRHVSLWTWKGNPRDGDVMDVTVDGNGFARDSRKFVDGFQLWIPCFYLFFALIGRVVYKETGRFWR